MSWNLLCPFCQARYKVEPEHQGTVCRCAKCGKEFSIPDDVQAWLGRMPDPPGSKRSEPEQQAIAPDPADDDPVDRQDDPEQRVDLDEARRGRPPRRRRMKRCPECLQNVPAAEFCCHCGYNLQAGYRSDSGGMPFFCHLLNILGIFATFGGGLVLVVFGIPSFLTYLNPENGNRYFSGRGDIAIIITAFAVFFGGLMIFGLSSLIHRASRRW